MYKNVRLRQHRRHRNWRQSDVADQLGTTVTTIQRWERGIQQPSIYYRAKLCMLFGLSAPDLGLEEVALPFHEGETTTKPSQMENAEEFEIWTVPYTRNPNFTGRSDLLDCLMQRLSPHKLDQPIDMSQAALAKMQAIAIKGLGGIGKTQVVMEYAYRAREQNRYTHTIWINATSEETILTSFVTVVDHLATFHTHAETDQRKIVAAGIRWLEQCTHPWLLIIDNADDLSLIQHYLPRLGNGYILLTTRASAVGALASSIELDNMSVLEGTQFLLRRSQRLADGYSDEIGEVRRLVETLGQFPLALDQAGAYIEESGCDFSTYLQLYQDHRQTLLARRGALSTYYPHVIATTWCPSFQHIEQINPAATHLLHLCAFLSPDHIPEELLTNSAEYWPPELHQAVADPFTFNQLVQDLLAYSLVKRLGKDQMLSLHRLVQVVQIDKMNIEEQCRWAERVVRAVHALFPHNPKDVETWPECQRYLEQAEACDSLIQRYHLLIPEAAEILDLVGIYHKEHASYYAAEPLFQRALQIREQLVGSHHLYITQSLNNLAVLYWLQGKYTQAEPLLQQALYILEQHLGSQHPDTAQCLHNQALVYSKQGKYEQAELLFRRALSIAEKQLGPTHEKTAACLQNLADLFRKQGKYNQAEVILQQALAMREQQFGSAHVHTAYTLHALAMLYRDQGKEVQATSLFLRTLTIREKALESQHPDLAETQHEFATLLRTQGHNEQARTLYERALHIRTETIGSTHPYTVETSEHLSALLREMGKIADAEAMEEVTKEGMVKVLSE